MTRGTESLEGEKVREVRDVKEEAKVRK